MTNRQWLTWRLFAMTDEDFSKCVNVDCVYMKDGEYCADDCQYNCADGRLKWLKQKHEGDNHRRDSSNLRRDAEGVIDIE